MKLGTTYFLFLIAVLGLHACTLNETWLSTDAGPCPESCQGARPVCDEASKTCVECLQNTDCSHTEASACSAEHTCQPCTANEECAHLELALCDDGACVECTVETETEQCGNKSCNPATFECTGTDTNSVPACGACVADSECDEANHFCVPMVFMGESNGLAEGYCLKNDETPCASAPFTVPTPERASLSGITDVFCGINESVTTCTAVRQLLDNDFSEEQCTEATEDDACGVPGLMDATCETVNTNPNQCTYNCGAPAQCPSGFACNTYCGGS
jgi:hypothetical protein